MKLERVRPSAVQVTMHPLELTALIAAARWVLDGGQGALPPDAVEQLSRVLASYDRAIARQPGQATT